MAWFLAASVLVNIYCMFYVWLMRQDVSHGLIAIQADLDGAIQALLMSPAEVEEVFGVEFPHKDTTSKRMH